MPDPTESRITRLLGERYELIELLGKGGFASVYKVRNLRLQRTEALKVLSEALTEDPDFARRFEQEARVAAALDHPNIVKIYDYGAIEDFFWFSMQFIGGASVGKEIKARGHFDDATGARIAVGICDALAYSHARGVIHRDIKPDNILLDHEGRPYLTDFGVAKSQIALVKTHAGTLLGSPAYMSPEQLQGRALDGRSDLYSVGVTLYRMLSGALPFAGDDTFRATMKRLTEAPAPLVSRRTDVHPLLAEIVMRALERDPALRFPDAPSMREALEDFVTDVTPPRVTKGSSTGTRRATGTGPVPGSIPPTPPMGVSPTPPAGLLPTPPAGVSPEDPTIKTGSLPEPTPIPPEAPPPSPPPIAGAAVSPPAAGRSPAAWIAGGAVLALLAAGLLLWRSRGGERGAPETAPPPAATVNPAIAPPGPSASPTLIPPTESPTEEPQVSPTVSPRPSRSASAARPVWRTLTALHTTPHPTRAPTSAPSSVPTAAPTEASGA
ncbi:MAG TPA: protein kinase, partial [Thermoanaerobaculia bacterium]|nr:protein kinase [Thermoanaerobaculia bacterium]